tara:strand:+ start:293 stop:2374 length:2082 start_codon:yes stop_codon:yes gene_type:complete
MSEIPQELEDLFKQLNPEQQAAACHDSGPLLIIAGAGTGKTTTLSHRVAYLISQGIDPSRILLLTFSRRAANEMVRRVDTLLRALGDGRERSAAARSRSIWGGTFHSTAARLLRRYGKAIGLPDDFTIIDRSDAEDLMSAIRSELDLGNSGKKFPRKGTLLEIYSRCVNTCSKLEPILERHYPWCLEHADDLKKLFQTFVDRKEKQNILDYDDLLLFWHALAADPAGGKLLRGQFEAVLVDEYQDTNILQSGILKNLCPDGNGLTVVGDDAQSIYSFRAATVRNILDFPQDYPGTTIVTLEENYRSTQPILQATNQIIDEAHERHEKNLWSSKIAGEAPFIVDCSDNNEQADFVVQQVLEHREAGIPLQQQAVLFRASNHSLALEVELARRNIAYHKYGGLKFIETAHVKDLMAYLRLAENPRDAVSGLRVLTLLPGIGQKKAQQLLNVLADSQFRFDAWTEFKPPAATVEHWPLFIRLMKNLTSPQSEKRGISAEVHQVRTFYAPLLDQQYDNATSRQRDLEQLEQVASRFSSRMSFLEEITLDPPSSTQDVATGSDKADDDFLVLSTIHSSKGLEWDAVYVLQAADGSIPSEMSLESNDEIDEERRLFYVALTRAKNWLYVCFPHRQYFQNRRWNQAHSYAQLTRFVSSKTIPLFQRRPAFNADSLDTPQEAEIETTAEDIRKNIRNMWTA